MSDEYIERIKRSLKVGEEADYALDCENLITRLEEAEKQVRLLKANNDAGRRIIEGMDKKLDEYDEQVDKLEAENASLKQIISDAQTWIHDYENEIIKGSWFEIDELKEILGEK